MEPWRHDSLRCRQEENGVGPVAVVRPQSAVHLPRSSPSPPTDGEEGEGEERLAPSSSRKRARSLSPSSDAKVRPAETEQQVVQDKIASSPGRRKRCSSRPRVGEHLGLATKVRCIPCPWLERTGFVKFDIVDLTIAPLNVR